MGFQDFLKNNNEALLRGGIGLLAGRTANEQAALGFGGLADAQKQNKTLQFLQQTDPELAQAVQAGALTAGDAFKLTFQRRLEAQTPKKPPLMSAGKGFYNYETGDWIMPPVGPADADPEEWGLNPVWGRNAEGQTVLGQVSKSGKFKPLDMGDFTPTPVLQNIDAGTSVLSRNSRTGEVVAETPKDIAGAERLKVEGQSAGEASAALAGARQRANQIIAQVDAVLNDPNLDGAVGSFQGRLPSFRQDSIDFDKKLEQLSGQAFLEARQMLKGGGAITDFESQRAEAAIARLSTAQSEEQFRQALVEFKQAVQSGVQKLEMMSGSRGTGSTSSGVKWRVK